MKSFATLALIVAVSVYTFDMRRPSFVTSRTGWYAFVAAIMYYEEGGKEQKNFDGLEQLPREQLIRLVSDDGVLTSNEHEVIKAWGRAGGH